MVQSSHWSTRQVVETVHLLLAVYWDADGEDEVGFDDGLPAEVE